MAKYMTEQKKALETILKESCERAYTVDELCEKMCALYGESAPGKSTVYRLITNLVADGTVKRFEKDGSRRAAYQIIIGEHCDCHLHLKCTDCGKLLHLEQRLSDELLDKVRASSDFLVNEQQTVLFGRCAECSLTLKNK